MILIKPIEQVEKEIGKRRAKVVRSFRDLVDQRRYSEARRLYKKIEESGNSKLTDLRNYANIHINELSITRL